MRKIIEFFKLATHFGDIAKAAVPAKKSIRGRIVTVSAVSSSEDGLEISLSRKAVKLLFEKIAPMVSLKGGEQKFKARISIPARLQREEDALFFPLISIDMEQYRAELMEAIKHQNMVTFTVPFDVELLPNKVLLESGFFTSEVDFLSDLEEGQEYKVTLGDLVPEAIRANGKEVIKTVAEYLVPQKVSGFKMELPTLETPNHPAFMMVGEELSFVTNRLLDEVLNNPTPTVEEYLCGKSENKDHSAKYTIGHFAKSYPLGEGQHEAALLTAAMVHGETVQKVQVKFGPAGTGKSTALHTDMAQIEASIAIDLINGKKGAFIKPSVVTSTAQKAIEGLLLPYAKNFSGITYMGGSQERKNKAKADILALIDELEGSEPKVSERIKLGKEISILLKQIEERRKVFNEIKEVKLSVDFKNFKQDLETQLQLLEELSLTEDELKDLNEATYALTRLTGKSLEELPAFIKENRNEISFTASKIKKQGLLDKFFKNITLELTEGVVIDDKTDVLLLEDLVTNLSDEKLERYIEEEKDFLKKNLISKLLKRVKDEDSEKVVIDMIASKSWDEYARLHLFTLANKVSFKARKFNRLFAIENKKEVIRALGYFIDENPFRYMQREYPSVKAQETFLHWVGLVLPFFGSTLASVHGSFPGINKSITPFNFTIADEAGMITVVDMLKSLQLSDKAIIVGDPYQLQPIFSLDKLFENALKKMVEVDFWEKYSPTVVSAFHRAAGVDTIHDGIGKAVLLNEHRRCHKDIAELFKQLIPAYENLKVETAKLHGENLEKFNNVGSAFMLIHTENKTVSGKNTNLSEINTIAKLLKRVEAAGYDLSTDVGIITPYAAQSALLQDNFGSMLNHKADDQKIGTVHAFQGAEFKVIIFSSVVSKDEDRLEFINNGPYMMNVALSRAKQHFIMVGDYNKITSDDSSSNYIGTVAKMMKNSDKVYGVK